MTGPTVAYVNGRPVQLPPGSTVLDAVAAHDPRLAGLVRHQAAKLTDGVGRSIESSDRVVSGTIVRVIETTHGPE